MYALYGAGGFGREVVPLVGSGAYFIDDNKTGMVNGYKVITEAEFLADREPLFNIAIADGKVREKIANRLMAAGARPFSIWTTRHVNLAANSIGQGAIICPYSTITANATMGRFFHCNVYSYVAHDCIIGDYVTFAPRVCCNGNVKIGDHAYIGAGAIIRQGITIGEGAVIGMGAVVVKGVEPYTTIIGNPGRVLYENPNSKR